MSLTLGLTTRSETGPTPAPISSTSSAPAAKRQGVRIRRDKYEMTVGDRISKFMQRLAQGDRVIVVLSDKYLKSPFCMYELYLDLAAKPVAQGETVPETYPRLHS